MKRFVLLASMLLLTACTGMRGPLPAAEIASQKRIAVVSLLGNQFHVINVGSTVFGNVNNASDVSDWRIDEESETFMIDVISRSGSRSAFSLHHDSELSRRLEATSTFTSGYNYSEILGLAKSQGADTVLVVHGINDGNAPFHKPGYGFIQTYSVWEGKVSCVYTTFVLQAFSTDNGKEVGWERGTKCGIPETEFPWKERYDDFSGDERKLLKNKVKTLVKGSIQNALTVLGY